MEDVEEHAHIAVIRRHDIKADQHSDKRRKS